MDEPPAIVIPDAPVEQRGTSLDLPAATDTDLPMTQRSDGSLVIDLMPLAPAPQQCAQEEPDPFNPTILVCRKTEPDPRLGADYDPRTEELLFGSDVPRAPENLRQCRGAGQHDQEERWRV